GDEPPPREVLLIVDDDEDIRSMLAMTFRGRFEIFEAADGIEAFLMASAHRPDYVLLDYKLPRLDGRYAAEMIRDVAPEALIVAFSGALTEKPEWADLFVRKSDADSVPSLRRALQALDRSQ
ncbi:MAG: response regulator, partial [Actinomycetota bacterium]|nr:response regulator [Actinomycetota bacterium]